MEHAARRKGQAPNELDSALADWQWLGQVARRIVADAGLIDDARQSAWMSVHGAGAAIQGTDTRRARLYWALRSFASREHTSARRRRRREERTAQPEALPSTQELILRGEQQQRVWLALRDLDDPLRSALLLHFQDGLSANEIATRSELKADTVRRRIQRGLAVLRTRLERDRDGGGLAALVAATRGLSPAPRSAHDSVGATASTGTKSGAATLSGILAVKLAAGLTVLGAATLAGWSLMTDNEQPAVDSAVALTSQSTPGSGEALTTIDASAGAESSRTPGAINPAPGTTSSPTDAAADPVIRTARVLIHDHDGQLISEQASGVLEGSLRRGSDGHSIKVRFQSGRVELPLGRGNDDTWLIPGEDADSMDHTSGAELSDLKIEIKGGSAEGHGVVALMESPGSSKVLRDWDWRLEEEEEVTLRLRTIAPFRLNVVDGNGGATHLTEVDVDAGRGQTDRCLLGTGRKRARLAESMTSPITLAPRLDQVRLGPAVCFVRSPGYAWTRVELDLTSGAERTVKLRRGGSLKVTINGDTPEGTRLCVRSSSDETWPLADIAVNNQTEFTLLGAPVGSLSISLKRGTMFDDVTPLAEGQVQIEAGTRSAITLAPSAPTLTHPVSVSLDLRIPIAWELEDPHLTIRKGPPLTGGPHEGAYFRISDLPSSEQRPGEYRFDAGPLLPGTYNVKLSDLEYQTLLEVPPEGLVHELIQVPEPVSISAVVLDAESKMVLDSADRVTWHPESQPHAGLVLLRSVRKDTSSPTFEFEVTAGPIELSASGDGLRSTSITVEAFEGMHVELLAQQRVEAIIELRHGVRALPWPSGFNILESTVTVEGSGRGNGCGIAPNGRTFYFTEPGRYRFTPPVLDGFLPLDPIEFEVRAGEVPTITLELTAIAVAKPTGEKD